MFSASNSIYKCFFYSFFLLIFDKRTMKKTMNDLYIICSNSLHKQASLNSCKKKKVKSFSKYKNRKRNIQWKESKAHPIFLCIRTYLTYSQTIDVWWMRLDNFTSEKYRKIVDEYKKIRWKKCKRNAETILFAYFLFLRPSYYTMRVHRNRWKENIKIFVVFLFNHHLST